MMSKFAIDKLGNKVCWSRLRSSDSCSIEIQYKSEYLTILGSIIHIKLVLIVILYVLNSLSEFKRITHYVKQESKEEISQSIEPINFVFKVFLDFKQHVVAIDGHIRKVASNHPGEV